MDILFSSNKINSTLLFLIPSLLVVSWLNVYFGNDNYSLENYITSFIVPAILFAYSASLIAGEILAKYIKLKTNKILPAFVITFILSYFIINLILLFFGVNFGEGTMLLTPKIPVFDFSNDLFNPCAGRSGICNLVLDPIKTARQFYIPYFLFTIISLIVVYKNASGYLKDTSKSSHRKR